MKYLIRNFFTAARQVFIGTTAYYLWIAFLSVFILLGKDGRVQHVQRGPIRGDDIQKIVEKIAGLVEAG